jgi:inorganic phosphate transporter, PiT family
MVILSLLLVFSLFMAYANGANDKFKGVATFYGSGAATYKPALTVATAATFAGSVASLFMAEALACTAILVICATPLGLPRSTTHVATGSTVGIGLTNGTANMRVLAAWLLTIPVAAALGVVVYYAGRLN